LEDIADTKAKSFDEILDEIEAIVFSGTKINLNYVIDEMLDGEQQEEVLEYFKESNSDSIAEALEDFDDDYTNEELRLMRIKFLSDFAN